MINVLLFLSLFTPNTGQVHGLVCQAGGQVFL